MTSTAILCAPLAGLRSQAIGLAEAAGWQPTLHDLVPRGLWRHVPAVLWPNPLRAVRPESLPDPIPDITIGCGGKAAAVVAAMPGTRRVIIQHPRMSLRRFDLVVANRHDGISGANVIVIRTALHRVTPQRLGLEAEIWRPRFAHLPRPLVAVLIGGSNGRYRLGKPEAEQLAAQLVRIMEQDGAGIALTPSRRTDPEAIAILRDALVPRGAFVWDFAGENPYFGMLALADAIVATCDSVSMISEAAATKAPLFIHRLPGHSRRQALFLGDMLALGRARDFAGRLENWNVTPIDDTREAAEDMRRRLGV